MVVLRCTQKLLARLKQVDDLPPIESTTRLGDWYGNIVGLGRRQTLMFISERSRLPVLIPIREARRLDSVFPDAACRMMSAVGVSAGDIEDVLTYANAAAALNCRALGARAGVPSADEVEHLLASRPM